MNCDSVQNETIVERYVLGQLNEAEQSSFEDHFFGCDRCFEEVRLMQALQAAAVKPHAQTVVRMHPRKWVMWGAAAAVLVAGFGLVEMRRVRQEVAEGPKASATQPAAVPASSDELQLLARVEAPRYTASNLRSAGAGRGEQFRAAMAKYSAGEYAAAAEGLRGLVSGGAETAAARFYLAVADLMTGNIEEAATQLRSTEAMGEGPYLEEARFFLAKALLAKRDVAGATRALEETVALRGDREAEARRMLETLRALPAAR